MPDLIDTLPPDLDDDLTLPDPSALDAELCSRSLFHFVQHFWPVLEPSRAFVDGVHIRLICRALEKVTTGESTHLLINLPPRHGKSNLVSILWPAWVWTKHPGRRWLTASYAQPLAERHSTDMRRLIESPEYQRLFGHLYQLSSDVNQKARSFNNSRPRPAAGSSSGTGGVFDLVCVVDDKDVSSFTGRATADAGRDASAASGVFVAEGRITSDYSVVQVWGKVEGDFYLLYQERERADFRRQIDLIETALAWVETEPNYSHYPAVCIEKAANGAAILSALRGRVRNLIPIRPEGSKETRAVAVSLPIEAGHVHILGQPNAQASNYDKTRTPLWVQQFVDETAAFPAAPHDDQVDAMTQAIRRLSNPGPRIRVLGGR